MHQKALEKLASKVEGSLKQCLVKDNWPQFESFEKHVDSLSEELLKHKRQWLTISDIYSIFYDLVYESVRAKHGDQKQSGPLWTLLGEDGGQKLKNEMVGFFESIPRPYEIYVKFPAKSVELPSISLGENLAIVLFENAKDVPGGYPTGLLGIFDQKLQPKRAYLRYRTTGYCSQSLQNRTVRSALTNFKIAFQQSISKKLLATSVSEHPGLGFLTQYTVEKAKLISVDKTPGPERVSVAELAVDVSGLLNSLDINSSEKTIAEAVEKNRLDDVLKGYLRLPALLMENREPEAERIKSAMEWCFDSYATENETVSFLQVCFGLESLLGDETGNDSLTSTLADRCAYLVGSDIKGRNSIREQFKELYAIRSKLVHGTATWLDPNQRHFLRWGRSILEYAIFQEVKHLGMKP